MLRKFELKTYRLVILHSIQSGCCKCVIVLMYHLYTSQYNVHVPCVLCGVMVITLDLQSGACYTFI